MLFPSAATMMESPGENEDTAKKSDTNETETPRRSLFVSETFSSFQPPISSTSNTQQQSSRAVSDRDDGDVNESETSSSEFEERLHDKVDSGAKEKKKKSRKDEKKKRKRRYSCSSSDDTDSDEHGTKKKKKKRKKKDSKKKKKRKHKNDDQKKKKTDASTVKKPDTIWLDETTLDTADAFRRDKRPDRHNIEYGCLYKMDVARFYKPNRSCLGLKKGVEIVMYPDLVKGGKKKKKDTSSCGRYFKKGTVADLHDAEENTDQFIHSVESTNFIPIHRNLVKDSDEKEPIGDEFTSRKKRFAERLHENPNDVRMWIEFVDAQDDLAPWTNDLKEKESWLSSHSLREKKIGIMEKALLKNPASIELIVKHMHLVKEIWSPSDLREKWKKLVFQFPNRSRLWLEYTLHVQSELITMTVNQVIDIYRKCFRMLLGIHNGSVKSHEPEHNSLDGILMVFTQLSVFLWQAGHSEKVTSMFRCFLEYNWTDVPQQQRQQGQDFSSEDENKRKKLFEEYFENGAPKFGDKDSISWSDYTKAKMSDPKKDNSVTPIQCIPFTKALVGTFQDVLKRSKESFTTSDDAAKHEIWLRLERVRSQEELLSFHGDSDDCEDTERIVFFDDISFVLFSLGNEEGVFQILLTYLLILGIPIPKTRYNKTLLNCCGKFIKISKSNMKHPCYCHSNDFCDFVQSVDSKIFDEESCAKLVPLIRRTLSQSLEHFSDVYVRSLSIVWIHFETVLFRRSFEDVGNELNKKYWKEMRKFVKSLLKLVPNRSCVALWNMYSTYEWHLGNNEDAEKIFSTAVQLSSSIAALKEGGQQNNTLTLCGTLRSVIDLFVGSNNVRIILEKKSVLLHVFSTFYGSIQSLKLTEDGPTPPLNSLTLLRISKQLAEAFDTILKTDFRRWDAVTGDFLCCYVVFTFFFAGITSLVNVTRQLFVKFEQEKDGLACPDVFVYATLLMKAYNEANLGFFSQYKSCIERYPHLFPSNGLLNCFYMELKRHGMNSLEVRRVFEKNIKAVDEMEPWSHYIEYEKQRMKSTSLLPCENQVDFHLLDSMTGTHHRICSIYQRMLSKESFRYCVDLWIDLIEFHLEHGNQGKARDTLYTALRNCPSSKKLYLLGLKKMDNFQEMYDLMMEKEIRVKLIIEELDVLLEN